MAFSFSNAVSSGSGFAAAGANVKDGPELREIQTSELGFAAVNGESKVQLLPAPWPADSLPPPSSSLLSVASARGLLAAGGPDAVYLTSTKKVRETFRSPPPEKSQTRSFEPEIRLPYPRSSHVTFSSDESVLVVAPSTGGIVAFQVESLQKGQLDPALQIETNGQALRALVPNPVSESAELFAVITSHGDLMLLDLKAGGIKSGDNGNVLRDGVSCLSWSNRGKQLVAGMADGTAVQLKPDGSVVANIPKSTSISAESHVSGISWLENDTFFVIYTPNETSQGIQPSEYCIVQRETKTTNYTFQKLPEILPPFGVERLPSFHFISRLRNFPPHLQDLLFLTATTATDIGLVSKSDKALSQDEPVTGAFTLTMIEDDNRRAQLPLSSGMQDTSPIGMAVDLSSSEKVANPIWSDLEIEETDGPVPCLLVLNDEGILVAWWVIYNESVRQKTTFPGLAQGQAAKEGSAFTTAPAAQSPSPPLTATTSNFGTTTAANAFAKASGSTFGGPFAAPSAKPFGTSTPISSDKPSWASTGFGSTNNTTASPAFGQAAFGSTTPMGGNHTPAFGSASAIGNRGSAFGQPSAAGGGFGKPSPIGAAPAFGQASAFGAPSTASPFSGVGASNNSPGLTSFSKGGGFAAFAGEASGSENKSPFAAASAFPPKSGNSFGGDKARESPFAAKKPADTFTSFGSVATQSSPFTAKNTADASGTVGTGNSFNLQSSFKGDGSAKDDLPPPKDPGGFSFGTSFGDILGESKSPVSPTHDKEAEMDDDSAASEPDSDKGPDGSFRGGSPQTTAMPPQTLVTPPSTITQSKATPAPPVSNLFGQPQQDTTTPRPQTTTPGWSFNALSSTTPKETPNPSHLAMFGTKTSGQESPAVVQKSVPAPAFQPIRPTPDIKKEPPSDDEDTDIRKIPEAPLPPDTVSKPRYASGETSASSNVSKAPSDDVPLPPDFLPVPKAGEDDEATQELPEEQEDDFSSHFEEEDAEEEDGQDGEGEEDVDEGEQLQTSPESSFKSGDRSPETSPTGGLFTKVTSATTAPKSARPLFGEVGTAPIFAPPKPHESPRSPSPIRPTFSRDGLRADPSRSVSAPAHPRSIIDQQKAHYQQSGMAAQAARMREEEAAKEKTHREAVAREKARAEAEQIAPLEDEEDERLAQELERPITPSKTLDYFIPIQPRAPEETSKTGIPAQIERLYSDINSMVYTLGINYRSLTAFIQYQQPEAVNQSWPGVLKSETPMDALNDERYLADISRLHEGQPVLSSMLTNCDVEDYLRNSGDAQAALKKEVFDLRSKLTSIHKTLRSVSASENTANAPLSSEQQSFQHEIRRSFTAVQTKMVQVEDAITVLRAKLAQSSSLNGQSSGLGRASSQKKPTVEAVTKTVGKMLSMAEQKSADIDMLEAQLKKLNVSVGSSLISVGEAEAPVTPSNKTRSVNGTAPGSAGSVYHTPDSKFGSSTRTSRGFRTSQSGGMPVMLAEDKQRWQAKAKRRKAVASMLKEVLEGKQKKATSGC